MPSRFAQQFSRTGAVTLVHQFGDDLIYYAGGIGDGRAIRGMIERSQAPLDVLGEVMANPIVIRVLDDATTGISSTEIDTGVDLIGVPLRVGEEPQQRQITRVLSTENGIIRFELA